MATGDTYGSKEQSASLGEAPNSLGTGGGGSTFGVGTTQGQQAQAAGVSTAPSTPGLYGAGGVKSQEDVLSTTLPTGPEQINAMLAPYLKELTNLGPEYATEMSFLAPYLSPAHQNFQQLEASSKADESPTGSQAVSAADTAAAQSILNTQPGFSQEAAAGKQAIGAAPYEADIQAGLGYQKYLATYGGEQTPTGNWPTQAAQAYADIMGGASSGGNLPSITAGAAAQNANQNLTNTLQPTSTGGGSSY